VAGSFISNHIIIITINIKKQNNKGK